MAACDLKNRSRSFTNIIIHVGKTYICTKLERSLFSPVKIDLQTVNSTAK